MRYHDFPLGVVNNPLVVNLYSLDSSFSSAPVPAANDRFTEDDQVRLTEDEQIRIVE